MPRKLRIEYPGAMYHVMSRGDRREKIFLDDVDRQDFIKTLAEACQKTNWQVHAYCLMPNHYHLVLETPEPNLVAGMAWLQSTYTIRLNHRHQLFGHVLSGRYNSQLVEGSGNQGKFATAANPLGFHVLAWTVPLEATPQPLPAKARTPNHFAQGRCRANTPMFGAGRWI
jgi:REP element-mobilizing transposase RayT